MPPLPPTFNCNFQFEPALLAGCVDQSQCAGPLAAGISNRFADIFNQKIDNLIAVIFQLAPERLQRFQPLLGADRYLGPDLPAARGRDAEVAVLEEGAPTRHQGGGGRRRVRQLARRVDGCRLSDRRARIVHHGDLL